MKRLNLNTDTTLNSNSNTLASSQKAIKAYADTKLSKADKAVANGVASLDASGKVPVEQIPALPYLPTAGGTLSGQLFTNSYISFNTSGRGFIFPGGGQINGFDTGNVFLQNANNGLIFRQSDKQLVRRKDNIDSIILTEAEKAVANGVASLDVNAKVPSEQIPVATSSTLGGVKVDGITITATAEGVISASVASKPASYAQADLPAASEHFGEFAIVIDQNNMLVWSNGTAWKQITLTDLA